MNSIELPLRVDEQLQRIVLPKLEVNAAPSLGSNDCLVLCSGFEDRALAVLESAIQNRKESAFNVLRVDYLPRYEENQSEKISRLCSAANLVVKNVCYDRESPAGGGILIAKETSHYRRVFIDISGMSRLLIVQILAALGQRAQGFKAVGIFYTEANSYPPTKQEFEDECQKASHSESVIGGFISTGVFEVAVTPELSSVAMQGEAIRLIAFPSFNRKQLYAVISEVQPTFIDLVDGIPPNDENKWRPDAIRRCNDKVIRGMVNLRELKLSTLDYRETFRFLLDVYNSRSAFDRLIVAPTGSKMQAASVGLFRAFMHDVQIVYPTPEGFPTPTHHTEGVKNIYHLPLDEFASVKSESELESDLR